MTYPVIMAAAIRKAQQAEEDSARKAALNLPERTCLRWYPHRAHQWLCTGCVKSDLYWCNGEPI